MGAVAHITEQVRIGPAEKAEIIDALYVHMSLPAALEALGHSLKDVMEEADVDSEFRARLDRAETHLMSVAEQEAKRRAIYGVEEPVVANGKVVYIVQDGVRRMLKRRVYSDGLLQFLLKSRNREVFGDKLDVKTTHQGAIAVPLVDATDVQAFLAAMRGDAPAGPNLIEGEATEVVPDDLSEEAHFEPVADAEPENDFI